jgi:hypothetical protein
MSQKLRGSEESASGGKEQLRGKTTITAAILSSSVYQDHICSQHNFHYDLNKNLVRIEVPQ